MKVKVVPEPPQDLDDVSAVSDALPRVPRSESDCCARLADRVDRIEDRDAAREWLVFLGAVGLAERTADGNYVRPDDAAAHHVDRSTLASRLRDGVFGAETVLDALDPGEPRDPAAVFEALEPELPAWERQRRPDAGTIWRERVERLLEWWVLLGEATGASSDAAGASAEAVGASSEADGANGGYVRAGSGDGRDGGRSGHEGG